MLKKKKWKALKKAQKKMCKAWIALNSVENYEDEYFEKVLNDAKEFLEQASEGLEKICIQRQCFGCKYYREEE